MGKRKEYHRKLLWKLFSLALDGDWRSILILHESLKKSSLRSTKSGQIAVCILMQVHASFQTSCTDTDDDPEADSELIKTVLPVYFAFAHLSFLHQSILFDHHTRASQHAQSYASNLAISVSCSGADWLGAAQSTIHQKATSLVPKIRSQIQLKQCIHQGIIPSRMTIVLGMHRSGTSALTGMLCQAGFDPPLDLMPPTEANPKGYWESWNTHLINDAFLRSFGASWRTPNRLPYGWEVSDKTFSWHHELLQCIAKNFTGSQNPILKDPRFCILLAGLRPWLESERMAFQFLLPIRDPLEVARSLELREHVPAAEGIGLWLTYVFSSELHSRGHPRQFLEFNNTLQNPDLVLQQCKNFVSGTAEADDWIPIDPNSQDADACSFIDADLRHQYMESLYHDLETVRYAKATPYRIAVLLHKLLTQPDPDEPEIQQHIDGLRMKWEMLNDADKILG